MKMKKILIFTMTFLLALGNFAMAVEKEKPAGYFAYDGTIEEVDKGAKNNSVLVKNDNNEEEELEEIFLYTDGALVMDLKTGKWVEDHEFAEGDRIQYFFREDTPMFQSMPPKLTPDVIGINTEDGKYSMDVDHFTDKGQGVSNRLVIQVDKDLVAQNLKGEEVQDFLDRDLVVLYTVSTRSLPPQTNPDKVFVIEPRSKVVDLEDFKAEGNRGYYLRKYYEALGATVDWNPEERLTTISLGNKNVNLLNFKNLLTIEDMVFEMEDFSVKDGTSYISEKDINEINDYLLK